MWYYLSNYESKQQDLNKYNLIFGILRKTNGVLYTKISKKNFLLLLYIYKANSQITERDLKYYWRVLMDEGQISRPIQNFR